MRRHLLVVSEKKIKMLKTTFAHAKSITGGATIIFCAQPTYITNICIQQGLIIFNTVGVMLRTDDAGHRTMDAGRWTLDAGPKAPYYKLTGELKIVTKLITE